MNTYEEYFNLIESNSKLHFSFLCNEIPINLIHNWIKDTEHGVFHGLMVGFIAYLYQPSTAINLFYDFILHDFIKCSFGNQDHDISLKQYFVLDEETYRHSNPSDIYHPLVVADRVELMRYPDHKQWLKWDQLDYPLPWNFIHNFYAIDRPKLEKKFTDQIKNTFSL